MAGRPAELAIRVEGLSKKYRLFDSPRQRLKEALDPMGRAFHKDFWALKDVSFEVPKGKTVGVIGRNGSGKSTLLQILTGVMQQTTGTVKVDGRVVALLELGAGFDPDFTGRQNVLQYGRMQGLSAASVEARMPEVEAFAGIGEFFDREVRSYSSGMFARLAFAAAIHADPDILILDEILAVGDSRFQQKCYDRLRQFQAAGKTVLIVSHALETIIDHCDSAILLEKGKVEASGDPKMVTDHYRELMFEETIKQLGQVAQTGVRSDNAAEKTDDIPALALEMLNDPENTDRFNRRPGYNKEEKITGKGPPRLLDYRLEFEKAATKTDVFKSGSRIVFHVLADSSKFEGKLHFGMALRRQDGFFVYGTNSRLRPGRIRSWGAGKLKVFTFELNLNLQSGTYFFDFGLFHTVGEDNVRFVTRRNVVQIWLMTTPHFDGIVDLSP